MDDKKCINENKDKQERMGNNVSARMDIRQRIYERGYTRTDITTEIRQRNDIMN